MALRNESGWAVPVQRENPVRTVTELCRFLAHDVTTGLRFARRNVKALESALETGSTETVCEQIGMIRARLDGAELILERVKHLGETVDIETTPQPVDLPLLARQMEALATSRGFAFEWEGPPLRIITAVEPLRLMLGELVRNALDHHDRPTGTVRLAWRDQGARIAFTVCDDGPGIPNDVRQRLFRFGGTVDPRNFRRHAGFGLKIVALLATVLDQDLEIVPNPTGHRGTIVVVTWPTHWSPDGGPRAA